MSSETIRHVLTARAQDVADRGPDLAGLHARVAAARRRRRAWAAGAFAAVVAVGGAVLASGEDGDPPDPAPSPTTPAPAPSPTLGQPLPRRGEPVEVLPTSYDRTSVERARVLTSLRNDPGDPTLEWTVDRTADLTWVQASCRGEPGSWLVVVAGGGTGSAGPCTGGGGSSAPDPPTMPFDLGISPVLPEVGERLAAFVTTVEPRGAQGPRRLRRGVPVTTEATFEVVVWGQNRSPVATILGREVSALATEASGRDWWFTGGVEAATGADSLTLDLPASPVDRVVQTVADYARFGGRPPMPFVQISLDGREVDHRFDRPRIAFQDETSAVVPAGGPHTVVLRVTEGRPEDVDFAAAVFEAGDRR